MKPLHAGLIALALTGCVSHLPPRDTPLGGAMLDELERDAPLQLVPNGPLQAARGEHFLFVAGFLNEVIPGYFTDNVLVVKNEVGGETSILFPSVTASVSEDAEQIASEADRLARTGKRVVLVGHSKGGAAVVLALLRHPELILSGKVDRAISIQGALGGSPVADSIVNAGPVRSIPFGVQGLESLTTTDMRALFGAALSDLRQKLTPPEFARVSGRVFYVRSWEKEAHVGVPLRITYGYLSKFGSGRNDGLVLEEDMKLEGFGVDLGALRSDHASLTVSGPFSNSSRAERKAFTRALLREAWADSSER